MENNSKFINNGRKLAAVEIVTAKIWSVTELKQLQDSQISIFSDITHRFNTPNHSEWNCE